MNTATHLDAQREKLARTLSCSPADLRCWQHIHDPTVLAAVTRAIRTHLAAAEARRLRGVVAAAQRLPPKLVAGIAQHHFGPVLCAATLGALDPGYAMRVSRHLPLAFLIEIAEASDPESTTHLANHMPQKLLLQIAGALIERSQYPTLAAFADQLDPDTIIDVLRDVDDQAAMVRIARFVEDRSRLDPIVRGLPDEHLRALVAAVDSEGLWADALDLIADLGSEQQTRLVRIATELDDEVLATAVAVAVEHDLWSRHIDLVTASGLWAQVVDLLVQMPGAQHERVAGVLVGERGPSVAAEVAAQMILADRIEFVVAVVATLPIDVGEEVRRELGTRHPSFADDLKRALTLLM